jgi:hypothetical protein
MSCGPALKLAKLIEYWMVIFLVPKIHLETRDERLTQRSLPVFLTACFLFKGNMDEQHARIIAEAGRKRYV